VTAQFRSAPWGVTFVSVEARGPYCTQDDHTVGRVLALEDEFSDEEPEEDVRVRIQA
jgi:hypothetical protein